MLLAYSSITSSQNKTIVTVNGEKITYDIHMSKSERDAKYPLPASAPEVGFRIFNTTTDSHEFYDGTGWYNYRWRGRSRPLLPGEVEGAAGKVWMDKNLGATQVATSVTDYLAYGFMFQWGRGDDGHEKITWLSANGTASGTTNVLWSAGDPVQTKFITSTGAPNDWRTVREDNLWQDYAGVNNPCPTGYRLPTNAEWIEEFAASNITNAATAYSSALKLPAAGYRDQSDGLLSSGGSIGLYWSSTVSGINARRRYFDAGSTHSSESYRGTGLSVRCLKD